MFPNYCLFVSHDYNSIKKLRSKDKVADARRYIVSLKFESVTFLGLISTTYL